MGRTYDPFLKNCNNFTKYFLKLILFNNIDYPAYVNRICKYAHIFSSFYPPIKRLYGNLHKGETCGSVSYLAEEINYFLKKNNSPTNSQSINNIELNLTKTPINFENLKNDEKYFGEKEKDKKKNNDLNSIDFSNLNKSSSSLLDDEALSRINTYSPQFIRYMNKDPYLLPLDYSSIYKAQVQGKMNIDINLESINNFFKHLQDLNDKMIRICNINPNINSLFNNNNYNYIKYINVINIM
jgi:hypothetical protein